MKLTFKISKMAFGGAERVFLSVAKILSSQYKVDVQFVVDDIINGETENIVKQLGFKLIGLDSSRTMSSIIPLKKYINQYKPDVLISAYTDTNMAAIISAKLAHHRCALIVSEHASLDEHWQHASCKRKMLLNAYVKWGYKFADHVLTVSQGIARQIVRRGIQASKVSYIYNPVRFQVQKLESQPQSNPDIKTILAVGRIAKQKDYMTLLRAFKDLVSKTQAQLLIVGGIHEQDEKERLDHFIQENALQGDVTFIGHTEDIQPYYRMADVFVLSSAWEGFGNVLVEALAFGLPVVSTDCNHGPAEILCDGQFGKLVPVGDHLAMSEALLDALVTSTDSTALQQRSLNFSEQHIASLYWDLIQRTVKP